MGLPGRGNDAAIGISAFAAARRCATRFRCSCRRARQMLIAALHPGNDWPELDAEFLSNLSPAHVLTTHSQDALHRLAGGGYARAAGLRDGAAGQHSIQLVGCRLGDPHRAELLLRERQ